jgi:putative two-component system response regulator
MLRRIRMTDADVAVVMMTGAPDLSVALQAMRLGAYDFLSKPLNLDVLSLTVDRAVEKTVLVEQNREYQRNLESMVQQRTQQLNKANEDLRSLFIGSIKALAQALEAKDRYTQGHSARVAEESVRIARYLSLSEDEIQNIWIAGFLHDIGKIGIQESVLNKPGRLDPDEWELVKQHPVFAARILEPIEELGAVIEMVRHHHEHFDGTGYPDGVAGADIPLGARILAVADAYDALTSERPYRGPVPEDEALKVFEEESGTQFDPVIASAFLGCKRERANGYSAAAPSFGTDGLHDAKAAAAPAHDA